MGAPETSEIFFHIGFERTGTSFLQRTVFPYLHGIEFIAKREYHNADQRIARSQKDKCLISHELPKSRLHKLEPFAAAYPNAKIIVVLRRADRWIASHFRRQVKNGYRGSFTEFFDLARDTGVFKRNDLFVYPNLEYIETLFHHKPLVLFYEDLRSNPEAFVEQLATYMGTKPDRALDLRPRHVSYGDKELRLRHWVARHTPVQELESKHYRFPKSVIFYDKLIRYTLLYLAKLVPASIAGRRPLVPNEQLRPIRELCEDDWERAHQYARAHRP